MKKLVGYRVFKVLIDNNGNVIHKTPVGFSRTRQGANALKVGCSGLMPIVIEEVYEN